MKHHRDENWFSTLMIGIISFAREKNFNHDFLALCRRLDRRYVGYMGTTRRGGNKRKNKMQRTYMHSHAIYLKRSARYVGNIYDFLSFFSFYFAVDRTRWTYVNSERTMKVITFKFGWLIFISAAQLPLGFRSDFFSLSCRMIAEGDDNDLLYYSLLRGAKRLRMTSHLLAEFFLIFDNKYLSR